MRHSISCSEILSCLTNYDITLQAPEASVFTVRYVGAFKLVMKTLMAHRRQVCLILSMLLTS
jgi:hypothetical protein